MHYRITGIHMKASPLIVLLSTAALLCLMLFLATGSLRSQQLLAFSPANAGTFQCDGATGISVSECEALVAFYNSTGGDNWITKTNWLTSNTICGVWYGVRCEGGIVYSLGLRENNLSGTLPVEMVDLQNLVILDLRANQVAGSIDVLSTTTSLRFIHLSHNSFEGNISNIDWSQFQELEQLKLDDNHFSGPMPSSLGELGTLKLLWLAENDLSGTIPESFGADCINNVGGMCQLTELLLRRNELTGTLPISLGNLSSLITFDIQDNQISGEIPDELAKWKNLQTFSVHNNYLADELLIFSQMTSLRGLYLSHNLFTGTVPTELRSLTNLEALNLQVNHLRGPIPREVACLPKLKEAWFESNQLTVPDDVAKDCLAKLHGEPVERDNYKISVGHQTVPPSDIRVGDINERYVELQWEPLYRSGLAGFYEVAYTKSTDVEPAFWSRTSNQRSSQYWIRDLEPGTDYLLYLRTYAPPATSKHMELTSWKSEPIRVRTPGTAPLLDFTKEVTPTTALPGEEVLYRLTFVSQDAPSSVVLTDVLPYSMTVVGTPTGDAKVVDNEIRYVGDVMANVTHTIEYRAVIDAGVRKGSILFSEALLTGTNDRGQETHLASAAVAISGTPAIETLVLIYVSADNNLSAHAEDLFRKAEAATIPPGMAVLLLYDFADDGGSYYYLLQHDRSIYAQNQTTTPTVRCPSPERPVCGNHYVRGTTMWPWSENLGTYTSLREFVARAIEAYPAETVVLSLVGHGSGWTPTFLKDQPSTHDEKPDNRFYGGALWDTHPDSSLSTAQLQLALSEAVSETGKTIDLLYFDACLMAMSEIVYELKDSVEYVLASPSISWTSFRYDKHLSWPTPPNDPVVIARQWITNEIAELEQYPVKYPYAFTLLNLTGENRTQLLNHQDELATALSAIMANNNAAKAKVQAAAKASDCFDSDQDHLLTEEDYYCDLNSFAWQISQAFQADASSSYMAEAVVKAADALQAFLAPGAEKFVVYSIHNAVPHPRKRDLPAWQWQHFRGLSIYLPLRLTADDWRRGYYNPTYLLAAADGYWDDFVDVFYNNSIPPVKSACVEAQCVPPLEIIESTQIFLPVIQR